MKIKRTFSVKLVESVLTDPIIWEAVSYPGADAASYSIIDKRVNIYLLGYEKDLLVGLAIVHPDIRKDWYCHFQVFKEYRKKYANTFATAALKWVWDNTTIQELNASIPIKHPNVKQFSKAMGFVQHTFIFNTNKNNKYPISKWHMKLRKPSK